MTLTTAVLRESLPDFADLPVEVRAFAGRTLLRALELVPRDPEPDEDDDIYCRGEDAR